MDSDIVIRKLDELGAYLTRIQQFVPTEFEKFAIDQNSREIATFNLCLAVQTCVDITMHIISTEGYGQPGSIADPFNMIATMGLIDNEIASQLKKACHTHGRCCGRSGYWLPPSNPPPRPTLAQPLPPMNRK